MEQFGTATKLEKVMYCSFKGRTTLYNNSIQQLLNRYVLTDILLTLLFVFNPSAKVCASPTRYTNVHITGQIIGRTGRITSTNEMKKTSNQLFKLSYSMKSDIDQEIRIYQAAMLPAVTTYDKNTKSGKMQA